MTRCYFNAVPLDGDDSPFLPRFTLTGLRVPADELGDRALGDLQTIRDSPEYLALVVPPNERYRRRVDDQHALHHGTTNEVPLDDRDRAELILELAASRDRTLLAEVAKVEYGLARHVIRTQVLVLRYTKAVIALITTAAAVFVASGAVAGHERATPSDQLWIGAGNGVVGAGGHVGRRVAGALVEPAAQAQRCIGASRAPRPSPADRASSPIARPVPRGVKSPAPLSVVGPVVWPGPNEGATA